MAKGIFSKIPGSLVKFPCNHLTKQNSQVTTLPMQLFQRSPESLINKNNRNGAVVVRASALYPETLGSIFCQIISKTLKTLFTV